MDGAALFKGGPRPEYSEMKPPYAHVSRTALAVVAAAGTVWLSAFFLPGAVVEPIPLLPAIGSAAGKVVSVPGLAATKHAAAPRRETAGPVVARAQLATATFVPRTAQARPEPRAVRRPQHAHSRHRVTRPKHSAPVSKTVPASTTVSPSGDRAFDRAAPSGRAVGWHRKHDQVTAPTASAPRLGHGHGHANHEAPAVRPAPVHTAPAASPSAAADRHDNGKHQGDEHGNGNGNQGHGPGGKK